MLSWSLAVAATLAAGSPAPARVEIVPATAAEVLDAVRSSGAQVAVVNVWATWCIPCREELPDLLRFRRDHRDRGVALVLVSADFPDRIGEAREFLAEQGADFPSFLKSGPDQAFIDAFDPEWSGALPATFVYDAAGKRRLSLLKPLTYEALAAAVAPLLERRTK